MPYEILIPETTQRQLRDLAKRLGKGRFEHVRRCIEDLAIDPETKTEPLRGPLAGFRSRHVGRVRIIVKVVAKTVRVYVVAVGWHEQGHRRDIYEVLTRAIQMGTIDPRSLI